MSRRRSRYGWTATIGQLLGDESHPMARARVMVDTSKPRELLTAAELRAIGRELVAHPEDLVALPVLQGVADAHQA